MSRVDDFEACGWFEDLPPDIARSHRRALRRPRADVADALASSRSTWSASTARAPTPSCSISSQRTRAACSPPRTSPSGGPPARCTWPSGCRARATQTSSTARGRRDRRLAWRPLRGRRRRSRPAAPRRQPWARAARLPSLRQRVGADRRPAFVAFTGDGTTLLSASNGPFARWLALHDIATGAHRTLPLRLVPGARHVGEGARFAALWSHASGRRGSGVLVHDAGRRTTVLELPWRCG